MYTFAENRIDGQKEVAGSKASTGGYNFSMASKVDGVKATLGANNPVFGSQQMLTGGKPPEITVS